MNTVLLVEDDETTRGELAEAIAGSPKLELLAAVGSCREARAELERKLPKVLLTDLGLPDGSGIDLIREVKRRGPSTEAMVITVFGDERHVLAAIEAGATGYILKDASPDQIDDAILQLLAGGSPISPVIARRLLSRFSAAPAAGDVPAPDLTPREREVLELLVKGFTFPEIGGLLGISAHTVKSHVKRIYEKLAVRSRSEAIYEAMLLGLVDEKR
jgi:DNA-binding NarL/FixJ family response regulator